MVMRSDDAGGFGGHFGGTDEEIYNSIVNSNNQPSGGGTTAPPPTEAQPAASAPPPSGGGGGFDPESPAFRALPRHIQKQVESGAMNLYQATQVWNQQSAGNSNAPGGGPSAPEPRVEPTAPQPKSTTQAPAVGENYRGRPGLGSEDVKSANTFAGIGSKERGQRGFQGAVFSPHSLFGQLGMLNQALTSRPTQSGGVVGGATLQATSPTLGGGIPIDGGLSSSPQGGDDLKQLLSQMIQAG